jgi:hypothetical protein
LREKNVYSPEFTGMSCMEGRVIEMIEIIKQEGKKEEMNYDDRRKDHRT